MTQRPTTITVCDTCTAAQNAPYVDGQKDGEKLAEMIEAASENNSDVIVKRQSCLMGCKFGCNIAIQAEDKLAYVLGEFEPTSQDANGIVEYANLHAQSETGQVPFKTWPVAVKGHFRARLPVLDKN